MLWHKCPPHLPRILKPVKASTAGMMPELSQLWHSLSAAPCLSLSQAVSVGRHMLILMNNCLVFLVFLVYFWGEFKCILCIHQSRLPPAIMVSVSPVHLHSGPQEFHVHQDYVYEHMVRQYGSQQVDVRLEMWDPTVPNFSRDSEIWVGVKSSE